MLTPEQLRTLRSEAATYLDEVQALNGFREKLAEITIPDAARAITFADLRKICHDPEQFAHRLKPGVARDDVPHSVDEATVAELDEYKSQVEQFAQAYVFGAEWSARAVHDALRSDQPIRLPAHPPPTMYRICGETAISTVTLAPGSLIEGDLRDTLIELLETTLALLRNAEPVRADRSAITTARSRARKASARSKDAYTAVHALETYAVPGEGTTTELRPDRSRTWQHAVRRVEARLRRETATQNQTTAYLTVKGWLNAAVNGSWRARVPLEQTDAEDYFTTVRPRLEASMLWSAERRTKDQPSAD